MVTLDGSRLTFDEVQRVSTANSTAGERVEIAGDAVAAMQRSRAVVERLAAGGAPVYAVNTGGGLLGGVRCKSRRGFPGGCPCAIRATGAVAAQRRPLARLRSGAAAGA